MAVGLSLITYPGPQLPPSSATRRPGARPSTTPGREGPPRDPKADVGRSSTTSAPRARLRRRPLQRPLVPAERRPRPGPAPEEPPRRRPARQQRPPALRPQRRSLPGHRPLRGGQRRRLLRGVPQRQPAADDERHRHLAGGRGHGRRWPRPPRLVGQPASSTRCRAWPTPPASWPRAARHPPPEESDPDLHRLVSSFNNMADAVQDRIEREARFAPDVSHELRSPLTALTAAVEVLDARRDDLRPDPAGPRRGDQPGAPVRPDGARPPGDLPPRRRRTEFNPEPRPPRRRGAAHRRATASTTCRSGSTIGGPSDRWRWTSAARADPGQPPRQRPAARRRPARIAIDDGATAP